MALKYLTRSRSISEGWRRRTLRRTVAPWTPPLISNHRCRTQQHLVTRTWFTFTFTRLTSVTVALVFGTVVGAQYWNAFCKKENLLHDVVGLVKTYNAAFFVIIGMDCVERVQLESVTIYHQIKARRNQSFRQASFMDSCMKFYFSCVLNQSSNLGNQFNLLTHNFIIFTNKPII